MDTKPFGLARFQLKPVVPHLGTIASRQYERTATASLGSSGVDMRSCILSPYWGYFNPWWQMISLSSLKREYWALQHATKHQPWAGPLTPYHHRLGVALKKALEHTTAPPSHKPTAVPGSLEIKDGCNTKSCSCQRSLTSDTKAVFVLTRPES